MPSIPDCSHNILSREWEWCQMSSHATITMNVNYKQIEYKKAERMETKKNF